MQRNASVRSLVIVLILVSLAAACQSNPGSSTDQGGVSAPATVSSTVASASQTPRESTPSGSLYGEVRIWLSWNSDELRGLHRVIDRFLEQNPATDFSIVYFPEDELKPALESLEDASLGPSIVFAPSSWGPWMWSQGWVVDVAGRVDEELDSNVHPLAWSQVSYENARIGLPLELQGVVLYRNRELAGTAPESVQGWVNTALQLKEEGKVGIALDLGFDFTASQIDACDGSLFTESGEVTIDTPQGRCWLELLAFIRQASRVTTNTDEDVNLFETGQAGWVIDGTWNARRYEDAIGIQNLLVDLWPLYQATDRHLAGFVWTENSYLMQGLSDLDAEASWAFMRFLLTPEAQGMLSQVANADHLSVLTGLESSDILQREVTAALFQGVPRPLLMDLDVYRSPLESAVDVVAVQGADPDLAIDVALSKLELLGSGGGVDE
ncbi:MAG: extracellular solute-binding protein [Anaerolineales bacterium]